MGCQQIYSLVSLANQFLGPMEKARTRQVLVGLGTPEAIVLSGQLIDDPVSFLPTPLDQQTTEQHIGCPIQGSFEISS